MKDGAKNAEGGIQSIRLVLVVQVLGVVGDRRRAN